MLHSARAASWTNRPMPITTRTTSGVIARAAVRASPVTRAVNQRTPSGSAVLRNSRRRYMSRSVSGERTRVTGPMVPGDPLPGSGATRRLQAGCLRRTARVIPTCPAPGSRPARLGHHADEGHRELPVLAAGGQEAGLGAAGVQLGVQHGDHGRAVGDVADDGLQGPRAGPVLLVVADRPDPGVEQAGDLLGGEGPDVGRIE